MSFNEFYKQHMCEWELTEQERKAVDEFYKQHMCEWELTEQERKAVELAERYHLETEAYDRTVCTGPIRYGSILPANPHEAAQINRNAIRVRERIMCEAAAHGINKQDMARAISRAA